MFSTQTHTKKVLNACGHGSTQARIRSLSTQNLLAASAKQVDGPTETGPSVSGNKGWRVCLHHLVSTTGRWKSSAEVCVSGAWYASFLRWTYGRSGEFTSFWNPSNPAKASGWQYLSIPDEKCQILIFVWDSSREGGKKKHQKGQLLHLTKCPVNHSCIK